MSKTLVKAAILMMVLVVLIIGGWELYLRSKGVGISYDDGPPLWSDKRARVYAPTDKATVFIGSSRIKYDLDLDTWQAITGKEAVQLAIEGSTPVPVLEDLANDKDFKGHLVVDVTEGLFYSDFPPFREEPDADMKYYKTRTPAQRAGFVLNHALESRFVFLDKDNYSLNSELSKLSFYNRPGVMVMPTFPMEFGRVSFGRQDIMTPKFLSDTSLSGKVKGIWLYYKHMSEQMPPPKEDPAPGVLRTVKESVDKIRARGGDVIFVRTPSSGPYLMGEKAGFPRAKYWDQLLETTHSAGIHFEDNPATAHFVCPEWSHLSPIDAVPYTKELIKSLPPSFGGTGK